MEGWGFDVRSGIGGSGVVGILRAGDGPTVLMRAEMDALPISDVPRALGVPYTYWSIGGTDTDAWAEAERKERIFSDIPANHSPAFLPVIQPTLETGTAALVVAAGAWLGLGSENG